MMTKIEEERQEENTFEYPGNDLSSGSNEFSIAFIPSQTINAFGQQLWSSFEMLKNFEIRKNFDFEIKETSNCWLI